MADLAEKVLLITGASRGIGRAIALRAAADGAKIAVVAKTDQPHPKLPGTVHSVVEEINAAGGEGLACVVDIRFEDQIEQAVTQTCQRFGGIDIVVNNASAIFLAGTKETPAKRFDLMHSVNARGTFLVTQACLPLLHKATNPHVLMLSPPLNMDAKWFAPHVAYTMAKYGMSMCVLGMSEEFRSDGIAVNALWPQTAIATAAVQNLLGGDEAMRRCRTDQIVADAARSILIRPSRECTGNFFVDEDVLREDGVTDFEQYRISSDGELLADFFLD
ncbi:MAG: NAD(P)-dependent oxidoreductase [Pirellulaceae bacterium]